MGTEETGRYYIVDLSGSGKTWCVEPVGDPHTNWGDVNPATKEVEGDYGEKHRGSVDEKDSIITKENGFDKIYYTGVGVSPNSLAEKLEKEEPKIVEMNFTVDVKDPNKGSVPWNEKSISTKIENSDLIIVYESNYQGAMFRISKRILDYPYIIECLEREIRLQSQLLDPKLKVSSYCRTNAENNINHAKSRLTIINGWIEKANK